MNDSEFIQKQQAAVKRMQEMSARSAYPRNANQPMPPVPPFVKVPESGQSRGSQRPQAASAPSNGQQHAGGGQANRRPPETRAPSKGGGSLFSGLELPFLGNLQKDGDLSLILGLLLILMSEKADKKLLFALVYILM